MYIMIEITDNYAIFYGIAEIERNKRENIWNTAIFLSFLSPYNMYYYIFKISNLFEKKAMLCANSNLHL